VLGGQALDRLAERLARPALLRALVGGAVALVTLFPLTVSSLAAEGLWLAGDNFPRMKDWDETNPLATVIPDAGLPDRLVHVDHHSFSPAPAVCHPLTSERGHTG
jgi:hypothetical protein